jgi:DNA-binding response OmpR family regulator
MCNLLIVDDKPDQLNEVVHIAEEAGIRPVVTATDEDQAREFIDSKHFCLAVVDIMLSEPLDRKEGLAVIRWLRQTQPWCRIIALTTRGRNDVGIEALRVGADDFVCGEWKYVNWPALLRQRLALWHGVTCPQSLVPSS